MIIIIEGIASVDKTRFAFDLQDYYMELLGARVFEDSVKYVHSYDIPVTSEKLNTVVNLIEDGVIDHIILDGFHISEFVYAGIDRVRKNPAMYSIDERLAMISSSDSQPWDKPESDQGFDDIDPGMSYQERVYNPVVLVYVVPSDIKKLSEKMGVNLERHIKWYDDFFENSMIPNKIKVDYGTLNLATEYINEVLGITDVSDVVPIIPPSSGDINIEVGQAFVLRDEDGNELSAVVTEDEVELTATADDIRFGKSAITEDGLTIGTMEVEG